MENKVINVEVLRSALCKAMKVNENSELITSLETMQAIYDKQGINALFTQAFLDIMPAVRKYATRFVYNSSFTVDIDELINPVFDTVLSYDFVSAWEKGKKVFYNEEYFYSNILSRVKNAFIKMNAHNNKALLKVERIETRRFYDGTEIEVTFIEYYRKMVNFDKKGFASLAYDAKEMKIDIANMLTDKEMQVFKLHLEGYTVREIMAMVKNGRKIRTSMLEKLESYYLQVASDMQQVSAGIEKA